MYPGLGEVENVTGDVDTFLVKQMHALAIAIYDAKQRGDKAAVEALLARFVALANEYRARGAGDMTGTDTFILKVGQWIEDSVTAIPSAISALPTAVGEGLIRAAVPFALLYVGFLWLTSPRRKF
jgi:hypothetical protein